MFKTQMFIAGALLAGVAIGYFAGGHGDVARPAETPEATVSRKPVADVGEAASLKALRLRVAELEKLLADELLYQREDGYVIYDRFFGEWLAR